MEQLQGHLVLLMAPSGSGKKTLLDGLGDLQEKIYFAKTLTSRQRREGTDENPKYDFISRTDFESLVTAEELVEWAEFGGNLYGTPKSELLDPLVEPKVVFKEMELQGVQQIKKIVPDEHLTIIYIDAGTWQDLCTRITARAPISDEELEMRRLRYEEEIKFKDEAEIIISNKAGEMESAQMNFRTVIAGIIETIK